MLTYLLNIRKAFNSPFVPFDVVVFNGSEWWCGEPFPKSSYYQDGQGPGLFVRAVGDNSAPEPVDGSTDRRFYALTTYTRSDNVEMLVALGVKTADLFSLVGKTTDGLPKNQAPYVWTLQTPDPLYLFWSTDGVNWNDVSLGSIEKGDGPYDTYYDYGTGTEEDYVAFHADNINNSFMNGNKRFIDARDSGGGNIKAISTGTHILCWNGYVPTLIDIPSRADGILYLNSKWYMTSYPWYDLVSDGSTIVVAAREDLNDNQSLLFRYYPSLQDDFITDLAGNVSLVHTLNGTTWNIGKHGGRWVFFGTRNDAPSGAQRFAAYISQTLPFDTQDLDWSKVANYIDISDASLQFDLGRASLGLETWPADNIVVRGSDNGSIYMFQRKDLQDADDVDRSQIAVLEVPIYLPDNHTVVVYGVRHIWSTGNGGGTTVPSISRAAHLWSTGNGDETTVPDVTSVAHDWAHGVDVAVTDKRIFLSTSFDDIITHVRVNLHGIDVRDAPKLQVGVRVDSSLMITELTSYTLVDVFHNVRLPKPGKKIDMIVVVPTGTTIGEISITGHYEE